MTTASSPAASTTERELVIMRLFNAPRSLVFRAWTDPMHLMHWPGPRGFTATADKFDCRPGGLFRTCLHAPDGTDYWVREHLSGSRRALRERLVFTHGWEDAYGKPGPETVVTVTFAADQERQDLNAVFTSGHLRIRRFA